MRKLLALLALSVVAAPLAQADQSIAINLRGGAAKAWGDAAKGDPMSDSVDWAFPLQGDFAFRFTKNFAVGPYIRYAPILLSSASSNDCKANGGSSCGGAGLAFGLLAEYRWSERLDGGPWIGLGAGYEQASTWGTFGGSKVTATMSGFEGSVQGGMDFTLGGLTIGPYLHANLGRFGSAKISGGGQDSSGSIVDKALHGWYGLGIRVGILL